MAILAEEEKKARAVTAEPESPSVKPTTTQSAYKKKLYNDTMASLESVETSVPDFTSSYDSQISDIYDKIVNREPFKYDFSTDPMYGQYKESYTQQAKQAMRDTMGQAAALTGGYGSSYGQAVGQQQYDAYMQRLNDVLPELYGMAYDQYADEGAQLQTQLGIASDLRNAEYAEYRNEVADKQYEDAWQLQQAETRGQYGDFGGFADLYGEDAANKMRLTWASSNPVAAYTAGTISPDEYYQLTGTWPIGYEAAGMGGDEWGVGGSGWNPSNSTAMANAAATVNSHEEIDAAPGLTQSDRNYLHRLLDK